MTITWGHVLFASGILPGIFSVVSLLRAWGKPDVATVTWVVLLGTEILQEVELIVDVIFWNCYLALALESAGKLQGHSLQREEWKRSNDEGFTGIYSCEAIVCLANDQADTLIAIFRLE